MKKESKKSHSKACWPLFVQIPENHTFKMMKYHNNDFWILDLVVMNDDHPIQFLV